MQVKGSKSRVSRSSNKSRENKDGRGEGERSFGLANTKVCQGCSKASWIGKLLLLIHTELCAHSKTITQHGEERQKVCDRRCIIYGM